MRGHVRRWLALATLVGVAVACSSKPDDDAKDYEHVMAFDSARVRLTTSRDTVQLALELAVSEQQKQLGLMERKRLAENAGMLFMYDSTQAGDAGFWMYRTLIPLDIAFLDSAGVIRSVRAMVPCPTTIAQGCPTYTPDVPYRYALEVNAGYFARHGIAAGNVLLLQDLRAGDDGRRTTDDAKLRRLDFQQTAPAHSKQRSSS